MGQPWGEACAQVNAGHVELAQRQFDAARDLYQAASDGFAALGVHHLALEAVAGLADAALTAGKPDEALDHTEAILARLADGLTLDGLDEPLRVRLICWRVLADAADPRASTMLDQAHRELQAKAAKIDDPQLRASLLNNVPCHREIIAAWRRRLE